MIYKCDIVTRRNIMRVNVVVAGEPGCEHEVVMEEFERQAEARAETSKNGTEKKNTTGKTTALIRRAYNMRTLATASRL